MQVVAHAAVTAAFAAEIKRELEAYAYGPLVGNLVELEVGVRGRARAVVLVASLDVFVGEEFLADVHANLEVDILEKFGDAVFKCAGNEPGLCHFGVLVGMTAVVVVEREEVESESAQNAQVEISDQVEAKTGKHGRCVGEEPKFSVGLFPLSGLSVLGFVRNGVLGIVFDGAELEGVDFRAQPEGKRNVRFP